MKTLLQAYVRRRCVFQQHIAKLNPQTQVRPYNVECFPALVTIISQKPMPTAINVNEKVQSTPPQWAIAILLSCAATFVLPQFISIGFVTWSFAGSFFLMYVAFQRRDYRTDLFDLAAWLPLCAMLSILAQNAFADLSLKTIDASLNFGIGPAFYAWGKTHHFVAEFFALIYLAVPCAAAISVSTSTPPRHAAYVMVLAAIVAAPLYLIFPAVGPGFVGQKHAIPNCMPSLHMTWAILSAWFCDKRLRTLFIIFATLTAIATLITGEHYVLDLLAAVPTAAFCIWVAE